MMLPDDTPTWTGLRGFGKSRVLRTSYFWIAFVPVAARMTSAFDGVAEFQILGARIPIEFSLPFQWQVFYWASTAFAAASGIFALRCPDIVKDFSDYQDFTSRGHDEVSMLHLLSSKYIVEDNAKSLELISQIAHRFATDASATEIERTLLDQTNNRLAQAIELIELKTGTLGNCWHTVLKQANLSRQLARRLCTLFYAIGWLLLSVVLVQGACSVIRETI